MRCWPNAAMIPIVALQTLQGADRRWTERADWDELLDTYARCVRITRDQPRVMPWIVAR